ncbi:EscI/YscI/HrpB family type III secretion system inner rod protein [Serratia marcescens]|uniref:EscI/YscI/HrpB family type III secretion system inner rod protein n=1 Tax=Serratia marcescens TaxID=615 RepID=UPI000D72F275|nr:EscI/YscI/HrpB family type III secretion system inner rod protein [Serratia marcescens]AWO77476.1 type III secretion system protein [Serratia marcescens]
MKINATNAPSLTSTGDAINSGSSELNSSDAAWFSAALPPQAKMPNIDNQSWIGKLSSLSTVANGQSNQADRALAKASRSLDPQSVMDANRTLSSYYLESLLNAKLVAKGVQSLEKLTNLQ